MRVGVGGVWWGRYGERESSPTCHRRNAPMQRTSRTHARHHLALRGRILRGAAGLLASLGMAAGLGVGAAGQAAANPTGTLHAALTATDHPGPHRVPGHYFTSPTAPAEQQRIKPRALLGPSTPIMVGDSICTLSVT